jgi:putative ABC transport system permease protein
VVVGVAAEQHYRGIEDSPDPMLYLPLGHSTRTLSDLWLLVRSSVDPRALAAQIREALHTVDPDQPLGDLVILREAVAQSSASRRFSATLIALFAGLALCLAVTGILGVTSYSLQQRTRELGVRMVLGADQGMVLRMVLGEGMRLVLLGGGLGLAGAAAVSLLLRGMLFGVGPADPAVYLGVTLLLGAVVLLGFYLPARRAARVDPMVALRAE